MAGLARFGQLPLMRLAPARALCLAVAMLDDPPSPCTKVCRIAPVGGLCEGCARTIDEIMAWPSLSAADKRAVWALIRARRA